MKISILVLMIISVMSCSMLAPKIKKNLIPTNPKNKKIIDRSIFCTPSKKIISHEIYGGDTQTQKMFLKFLESKKSENLKFNEKAALWTLLQLHIRPDLASPTSRIQFLKISKAQYRYWDIFFTKKDSQAMPFLKFLDVFLKSERNQRSLTQIASILQYQFQASIPVSPELAELLFQQKQIIGQSPSLRKNYFRGEDILSVNESLPKPQYVKLAQIYYQHYANSPYIINTTLQPYKKTPQEETLCNYDFSLYDNSLFLIDREMVPGHFFGLIEKDQAFFAMTSQRTSHEAFAETSSFKGSSQVRGAALCTIKNETSQNVLWLFSHNSRDPGQHLHQLLRKKIAPDLSGIQLQDLFSDMRFLFLLDPIRLVVESERGNKKEIEELLKFNTPLYHAKALGEMIGILHQNSNTQFLNDPRAQKEVLCQ